MNSLTKSAIILTLAMILACAFATADGTEIQTGSAISSEVSALPLCFIPNSGQTDSQVLYFVQSSEHSIYFLETEVILFSYDSGSTVRMVLEGADPASVMGIEPLSGKANFYIGSDPSGWKTDVAMYGGILYRDVLPGTDLSFRGKGGVLKREFVLAPGADPAAIRMKYLDAGAITAAGDGSLLITTAGGVFTEAAPVCFQEINGERIPVSCEYVISGDTAGFSVGRYDPRYPLVIDPAVDFADFLGGDNRDYGFGIGVDEVGNVIVTGSTASPDFPVADSAINATLNGNKDVFVTKLPADGSTLIWSTYLGGNRSEEAFGLSMDLFGGNTSNTTLITGYTNSLNFPQVGGAPRPDTNPIPSSDVFAAGLDQDGNLLFTTMWGGNESDIGMSIAAGNGTAFVTGFTYSPNFTIAGAAFRPTKFGTPQNGNADAFMTEFDWTAPATFIYSTFIGGANATDKGHGIATNNTTQMTYVTGYTESTNFSTLNAKLPNANAGGKDAFVVKFSGYAAPTVLWSEYLGGSADDMGNGVAIDSLDRAVVTGYTISPNFKTTTNAYRKTAYGIPPFADVFVTRFRPDGNLNYSTYLGGINSDGGKAVALDGLNNIYVTGYTSSLDFPSVNASGIQPLKNPFQDAFITMINENGKAPLNFSTFYGGGLDDTATSIAVKLRTDGTGPGTYDVFVTGYTTSFDLHTVNEFEWYNTYFGWHYGNFEDAFIVKMGNTHAPTQPYADFNGSPRVGYAPLLVNFTDLSTGYPDAWEWDFGDGSGNSTVQHPQHTYTVPGNYTVTLTVSNSVGMDTEQKVDYIQVLEPSSVSFVTSCTNTTRITRIVVPVNATRKFAFMLDQAPLGLMGYNFTLMMNNTTIANFTNVSRPCWMIYADQYPGFTPNKGIGNPPWPFAPNCEAWGNESPWNLTFAGIDLPAPPSNPDPLGLIQAGAKNVSLANLTIRGISNGTTFINVSAVNRLEDDQNNNMTLIPNASTVILQVDVLPLYPIPPDNPLLPRDPDCDGLYEDIDGDGNLTFKDVEVFFVWFEYAVSVEPLELFDFDQDGMWTYHDVIELFMEIAEASFLPCPECNSCNSC